MKQITAAQLDARQQELLGALRAKASLIEEAPTLSWSALDPADTLLVSIDINNGFAVEGSLKSQEAAALIAPTVACFEEAKRRGFATLAFCDRHPKNAAEFAAFPPHCVAETGEDEPVAALRPYLDRVVYKNSTNGFLAPESGLCDGSYRRFVLTGCLTEFCVFQLAVTLRTWLNQNDRAGEVIVPLSLIDSYDAPGHSALLHNIVYAAGMLECGVKLVSDLTD